MAQREAGHYMHWSIYICTDVYVVGAICLNGFLLRLSEKFWSRTKFFEKSVLPRPLFSKNSLGLKNRSTQFFLLFSHFTATSFIAMNYLLFLGL